MSLRKLLRNWPYKLLALATAIVLATYVHTERNPWTSVSVDAVVQTMHLQDDYIAKLSGDRISVLVNGPKSDVENVSSLIKSGDIKAVADLAKLAPGKHNVQLSITLPDALAGGVTVQPVTQVVSVTIDATSSRTMPVQVRVKSSPPIGFAVGEASINPSTATVSGAGSLVDCVAKLVVVVDPTPLRPSVDEYAGIKALDAENNEIKGVKVAPVDTHVALKLVEAPASKAVFVAPTIVGQPEFPYRVSKVTVTPSSVTVKGRPERLAGMSILSTDEIDVAGATSDIVRYVSLHVPPGIEIDDGSSVKVTVRISSGQNP